MKHRPKTYMVVGVRGGIFIPAYREFLGFFPWFWVAWLVGKIYVLNWPHREVNIFSRELFETEAEEPCQSR